MSLANIYGQIVDPDTVEKAVAVTISNYIDHYLGEMERLKGYEEGELETPQGVITASEFAKWDADALPLIMVVSPGLVGRPVKQTGQGSYEARWGITVAAIVSDIDELGTRRLMGAYAAAIRSIIVQHKALKSTLYPDGFAQSTAWVDEKYSDLPFADSRTLDSCSVVFEVGVQDAVTQAAGPRQPPETAPGHDPGPNPKVTGTHIDVEPVLA